MWDALAERIPHSPNRGRASRPGGRAGETEIPSPRG
jgi:hypothetical protein